MVLGSILIRQLSVELFYKSCSGNSSCKGFIASCVRKGPGVKKGEQMGKRIPTNSIIQISVAKYSIARGFIPSADLCLVQCRA